jgi:hypothetical protein
MVIKYEVMSKDHLEEMWEFERRFNTYEEAEAWITAATVTYWDTSYTILKVYKVK